MLTQKGSYQHPNSDKAETDLHLFNHWDRATFKQPPEENP